MVFWIWMIVSAFGGFGLCCLISKINRKKKLVGSLREDRSDPTEAPYLFLELEPDGFDKIHKSKYVILSVKIENYLPRK